MGENLDMQVINDLDRNSEGYSEDEGSFNDAIDMIFGNDEGDDDFKFSDDYVDNYDDEE